MSDSILTLREAAQIALEALDISRNAFEAWGNSTVKIDQAFDALTVVLAAPDKPVSNLFEFWWAEYMPEATQQKAWIAWHAAPLAYGVGVVSELQRRALMEPAKRPPNCGTTFCSCIECFFDAPAHGIQETKP